MIMEMEQQSWEYKDVQIGLPVPVLDRKKVNRRIFTAY